MHSKVQVNSLIPQPKKDLEEARMKWVDLIKEKADLTTEVKKVPKLEVEVDELKQNKSKLRNVPKAR